LIIVEEEGVKKMSKGKKSLGSRKSGSVKDDGKSKKISKKKKKKKKSFI
jgi:hypothetical protein